MGKSIKSNPQSKPKSKILNRIFAIIFAVYTFTCVYYVTVWDLGEGTGIQLAIYMGLFLIIFAGLVIESLKPSLDFTLNRNKRWIIMGVILLAVFVLLNLYWWVFQGFPNFVPQYGWQAAFIEYFSKIFACDTSILSLLFGILFLTNSDPQKSLSYKIMLIGAILIELQLFSGHILLITTGGMSGSQSYGNFWGSTILQPWYWCDLTEQITVFICSVLLLKRAKVKKLILILLITFLLAQFALPLVIINIIKLFK